MTPTIYRMVLFLLARSLIVTRISLLPIFSDLTPIYCTVPGSRPGFPKIRIISLVVSR